MQSLTIARITLLFSFLLLFHVASAQQQPNFILIVADDMGMSDMGAFGGEISTPNLDSLAKKGTRYTNYYVAPTCSPTRSMLMTGIDNHVVGMGNMYEKTAPNQLGQPGYEGYLRTDFPTLPEILKENGYHTYMAGKWHLGKSREHLPYARGFERSFSMLSGAGSYFDFKGPDSHIEKNHFVEDNEYLDKLPKGYYANKTYTDKIIEYIESNKGDGKPFLAYLAHQAPHDPLQVPNSYLRKYKEQYDIGWDSLRQVRMERMKELGVIPEETELGERMWYIPGYDKLRIASQVVLARKMEIYAALVENMDMEIGRLIAYLDENNMLDNTYIIFFSDNGPESTDKESSIKDHQSSEKFGWMAKTYNHGFQEWGRKGSFTAYGPIWAQVSATPFFGYKATTFEGGVRSPLIVVPPGGTGDNALNTEAVLHVKDITPTVLDLAGIEQPKSFKGQEVMEMQGKSWKPILEGEANAVRGDDDYIATELFGCKMLRKGDWKILYMHAPYGIDDWQLYNVSKDPGERNELSEEYPEKLEELKKDWAEYVANNNVIIPNRTAYDGIEDKVPPRPPVYAPDFGRGSETVPEVDEEK